MLKYRDEKFLARLILCLGYLAWIAVVPQTWAESSSPSIKSVKLKVNVDKSASCKLSLNGTIEATEMGTIWYRFEGPEGVTFDFGQEGTKTLQFDTWFGTGKGANMTKDIHGEFRLKAAMIGPGGKKEPITVSDAVPANYTCGGGSDIATPIKP
jgi:hypothetical protein